MIELTDYERLAARTYNGKSAQVLTAMIVENRMMSLLVERRPTDIITRVNLFNTLLPLVREAFPR